MGVLARDKALDDPAETAPASHCLIEVSDSDFGLVRSSVPVELAIVLILDLAYFLLLLVNDVGKLNFEVVLEPSVVRCESGRVLGGRVLVCSAHLNLMDLPQILAVIR